MKSKIKNYFYFLLARKECSIKEIKDKGTKKYPNNENDVDEIICELINNNYLSDDRYMEMMVRSKYESNYGSIRIKMFLKEKGIYGDKLIEELDNYDFYEKAKEIRNNRFHNLDISDFKQLQKSKNYLLRRGFTYDEVSYAFSKEED